MKGYKIMLRNYAKSIGRGSRSRKLLLNLWWRERCKKDNIDMKNVKITYKNVAHDKIHFLGGSSRIYSTIISIWERERKR